MGTRSRKEQKEQTRELLLQTAVDQFAENGILATTTVDIARAAGVAHGTIFVHFPTRDDLLKQVISDFGNRIGHEFRRLTGRGSGLREILSAHLRVIELYEPFYSRLVIEGPVLPRDARNIIFLIQSGIAIYLEKALAGDVERKLVRAVPIHLLLNSWLGTINYYLANRDKFAPGKSVIALCGRELLDHFMDNLELKKREG